MIARKSITWIAASAAGLVLAGGGVALGLWLGGRQPDLAAPQSSGEGGREVLYWYDPMVPSQHFDKPGKSPFMDMELAPRYADEGPDAAAVSIDPGVIQNLGVRLATVERGPVQEQVLASGVLAFNERDVAVVQAKVSGFVERAHRLAVGDVVRRGAPLVDLRAPEWTGAAAEYLSLRKTGDAALTEAARNRLVMIGVPEADIAAAERSGVAPSAFTIRAPIGGAVTALGVKDGMSVAEGEPIATVNGLSPVWLIASAPQGVAGRLQPGARAVASLPAYPGEAFEGRIESVLPRASAAARAVEVRIALPNPDARLRPGMTAEVDLSSGADRTALLAPAEAVIRTGRRSVVIAASDTGNRFSPVEVETGAALGDRIEIVSGLTEGQRIVASGQFLIDSEASLTGVMARLQGASSATGAYRSTGRVTAVDEKSVTIAHQPVPELNWPAMTMAFAWGDADRRSDISVGDEVGFTFREGGVGYVVESIEKTGDRT
jgi:Cu(I)/Ag(I) efflux system membrane fusion protein